MYTSLLLLFVLSSNGPSITTTGWVSAPPVAVRLHGHKTADREQMEYIYSACVHVLAKGWSIISARICLYVLSICERKKPMKHVDHIQKPRLTWETGKGCEQKKKNPNRNCVCASENNFRPRWMNKRCLYLHMNWCHTQWKDPLDSVGEVPPVAGVFAWL